MEDKENIEKKDCNNSPVETLVSKKTPLVYIEWLDSSGPEGWHFPDEIDDDHIIASVGWVTDETEAYVQITPHMQIKPRCCKGDLNIPKIAIKRRVEIKG